MSNIVRRAGMSLTQSKSVSGAAGKGMVAAGTGAIALWFVASLIPFIGVFGLGIVLIVLGMFFWE